MAAQGETASAAGLSLASAPDHALLTVASFAAFADPRTYAALASTCRAFEEATGGLGGAPFKAYLRVTNNAYGIDVDDLLHHGITNPRAARGSKAHWYFAEEVSGAAGFQMVASLVVGEAGEEAPASIRGCTAARPIVSIVDIDII